jgi:hypothetical protein
MEDDRADAAPTDHPHWVPSFGLVMVVVAALLVGACCGANLVFWLFLPAPGPTD